MPTFIDHHDKFELSPEMERAIADRIRAGKANEQGVKGLNLFLTKDGGAYCVMEAPDAEAVVRAHEAGGGTIRPEDVVEVRSVV